MRTLPPQRLRAKDYASVEEQLKRIFWQLLYAPLKAVIAEHSEHPVHGGPRLNGADDEIRQAIRVGRLQYHDGIFTGDLNAALARALRALGARFDKRQKVYRLAVGAVPPWIRAEAAAYLERAKTAHNALLRALDGVQAGLQKRVDELRVDPSQTLASVESGFQQLARSVAVMPTLSAHSKEELARAYTNNMNLWIQKWSEEEISHLRTEVERNAVKGYRFATLAKTIKDRYGVSAGKAKFLARQETALFMSTYRREKFTEAGIRRYRWSSSHDVRVRHDHRDLDGQVFSYDDPPIVDKFTGRRGNPGEDYNCRCVDIPIVGTHLLREAA